MERIYVTGATGRVGANCVKALAERGYNIRAYVRPGSKSNEKLKKFDCELVYGDLLDTDALTGGVKGCDRVLHIGRAGAFEMPKMSELEYWNHNVTGTFALTRACIKHDVQRLLYASTDSTYDAFNYAYLPIDEDHPQIHASLYGTHKVCGEAIVRGAHMETGLPVTIARISSVMVADEILRFFLLRHVLKVCRFSANYNTCKRTNPDRVPNTFVEVEKAMAADPDQLCIPRGRDYRPWRMHICDVRDTVECILLQMTRDEAVGEAFNIGWRRAVTWEEVLRCIARKTGRECTEIILDTYWDFELTTEKASRVLGFNAKYDLDMMVEDALRFRNGEDIGVLAGNSYPMT